MQTQISRRRLLNTLAISTLGMTFARQRLYAASLISADSELSLASWIGSLKTNAHNLRQREISPLQWQEIMDRIYAATPLTKFKDHLNFSQLSQEILEKIPSDRQEYFHRIQLKHPSGDDLPGGKEPHQVLVTKVAHVRKGESVPPHGHSSMVSAFLCLSGEFDVQLFDRLDNREDEMVVRHSKRNKTAGPGTWSSISDYRDNVHWLTAKTEDCFLFTCKMLSVEPKLPLNGRIHINLKEAKSIGNNTYIAPKISYARAQELY